MVCALLWSPLALAAAKSIPESGSYLFAYFSASRSSKGDGLHLAFSNDGLNWKEIKRGKIYFKPRQGMFRDPFILQGPDQTFHLTWTSAEKEIGYANSRTLLAWQDEKYLPVMANEALARNCWAPEIFYIEEKKLFMVYWSTTIPGRFPETGNSGDNGLNHRLYYTTTAEFNSFSPTKLLLDPGFNCIDADIVKAGENYIMFLKNETAKPVKKFVATLTAPSPEGPFSHPSEPLTPAWSEGPSALKIGSQWLVYFDRYAKKRYGVVVSEDLERWQDLSDSLKMPRGARHGCAFPVSREILDRLKSTAP